MHTIVVIEQYAYILVVAVTAYAFENGFEGGGDGLKIGCYRAQGVKMARRTVRAYNPVSRKYDGSLVRKKGDAYLVDCNVTGSSKGTEDNPKFPLKEVFQREVFPAVDDLVKEGGEYEGYLPIFRGDNAGPHKEKTKGGFDTFCAEYCEERGWRWEPQSAQSPKHWKSMVGTTILEMDCIATSGGTLLIATKALD